MPTVKIFIISVIALVIPLFFMLVLVSSLHGKLTRLRNRCREARERFLAAANGAAAAEQEIVAAREAWLQVVWDYNVARSSGLARVMGSALGFPEAELPPPGISPRE